MMAGVDWRGRNRDILAGRQAVMLMGLRNCFFFLAGAGSPLVKSR
jgi:hypothetical protein